MADPSANGVEEPGAVDKAEAFLREALAGGPRLSKELFKDGKDVAGLSRRSIERARARMAIRIHKGDSGWTWGLISANGGALRGVGGVGGVEPPAVDPPSTTNSVPPVMTMKKDGDDNSNGEGKDHG